MSCLSLGNKLPPPKKAWEGFASKLQRKLHKLKRSKVIKKTTSRLNTTLAAVLHRSPSFPSRLLQRQTTKKRRVVTRSSSASVLVRPHHHTHHKHRSHKQKYFSPVYVDELFTTEPISVQVPTTTVAATGKFLEKPIPAESSTASAVTVQQLTKVEVKLFTTNAIAETSKAAGDKIISAASATAYVPARDCTGKGVVEVPQLQGVDKRAEEFIAKFKEEIRLQRQRSFGEYQEMLERGA